MSVDNAVGQTFANGQVTSGTATLAGGSYTYVESTSMPTASVLVGGETMNSDGTTTLFFEYDGSGTITSGAVLGNTASSILLAATIDDVAETLYLTNDPDAQPGVNGSVAGIPDASSAPAYQAPCYCPGTLIRTVRGDVAVEELVVGDLLVTTSGGQEPVRWIGTRTYGGRFFAANPGVWPIRFHAGSLGRDEAGGAVPRRDLLVSPLHAMLVDGVLVPAELLVNGSTVVRDGSAGTVSYYHVELPGHHTIWAENAASESFADDGSRSMFHNAETFAAIYPGAAYPGSVGEAPVFCAPRVTEGEALDRIRSRLNAAEVHALAA